MLVTLVTCVLLLHIGPLQGANRKQSHLAKVGVKAGGQIGHEDNDEADSMTNADDESDEGNQNSPSAAADNGEEEYDFEELAAKFGLQVYEVIDYNKAFSVFDADGSGTIDNHELRRVFKMIGDKASPEQIDAMSTC
eukprot:SAG31_NODE_705_length_12695_cov_3.147007_15_plen_137_part_00